SAKAVIRLYAVRISREIESEGLGYYAEILCNSKAPTIQIRENERRLKFSMMILTISTGSLQ
ncbi:14505_t:CDS:2, partial [Funneliformis caledonium]